MRDLNPNYYPSTLPDANGGDDECPQLDERSDRTHTTTDEFGETAILYVWCLRSLIIVFAAVKKVHG